MAKKVADLIEPAIGKLGYELVGIEYGDQGRGKLLRIYIDNEAGIKLGDCATVSRRASALLDVEDLIAGHYDLEVSSPGVDRPLFVEAHYEQYLSHQVKIVMAIPQMGRKRFTGLLKSITDGIVVIEVDNESYELPFVEIASARLVAEL